VVVQTTPDGLAVTSKTITLAANVGEQIVGPFPTNIYNDASGFAHVTYNAVTGLQVAVVQCTNG